VTRIRAFREQIDHALTLFAGAASASMRSSGLPERHDDGSLTIPGDTEFLSRDGEWHSLIAALRATTPEPLDALLVVAGHPRLFALPEFPAA
jgi:hypothetical protein